MGRSHEITTIEEFRGVTGQSVGVVVITDPPTSKTTAHRTRCRWVSESYFKEKVIGGNKTGRYYFFLRYEDAVEQTGAVWCQQCGATG